MADIFDIHEWNKKRYLNEGIDLSPIQADKIHKFITKTLRKAVMDYNESLGDEEKQLRMSFFEQEFPLSSTFYNALNQAISESIEEEIGPKQKTLRLDELTFDLVKSMFGKIPMFGISFPNPDDSSRQVFNSNDLEDWKARIADKYGNVAIRIDVEAANNWEKIQVLDDKFRADKKDFVSGKGAWLDREREAGRSSGLDETKKEYGEKISRELFKALSGKKIKYQGKPYKVIDADEAILTIQSTEDKEDTKQINLNQFNKGGRIDEIIESIELGLQLDESKLCKRGQDYIAARKRAGEKSSAYLSGRGVKVCKGQIEFKGKKQKDFKG